MAAFILMTAGEAAAVRSATLRPVERQGGVYILNTLVLDDLAHAAVHDVLAALPTMDGDDPEFPAELAEEVVP